MIAFEDSEKQKQLCIRFAHIVFMLASLDLDASASVRALRDALYLSLRVLWELVIRERKGRLFIASLVDTR